MADVLERREVGEKDTPVADPLPGANGGAPRITHIEAVPVRLPYRVPWENLHTARAGARREWLDAVVLRVHAGGLEGIGEVPGGPEAAAALVAQAAPALRGASPLAIGPALDRLGQAFGDARSGWRAGLEFALHDVAGKLLGVPVYQLLGGRVRERVPLAYTMGMRPPDQLAAEARAAAERGFRHCIKLKVGAGGDLDFVLAVARAVPGVPVRPDSNMGHDRATAEGLLRAMRDAGVQLELVEDPCPTAWDDYAALADRFGVRLSVHGHLRGPDGLLDLLRHGRGIAAGNLEPFRWGVRGLVQAAGALEYAGIGAMMGTSHATGIKTAVELHLATAVPNLRHPNDIIGPLILADDVLRTPLDLRTGDAPAPEGPGLGVELDEQALAHWAAAPPISAAVS
jgi:muconate cycloisomerase